MKLSWKILLHLSWVLAVLLGAWSVLFYVTLTDEINDETDDMLENRAEAIVKRVLATGELPGGMDGAGESLLVEVPEDYAVAHAHERYSDEERYVPERDDEVPARVLRQLFRDREGRWYELTVMTPTIEKEDLQEAILSWCVWLYLLLLLSILLVTVWLLYRMMRPLYALLRWLDAYRVGGENPALETTTSVVEFRRLNEAVGRFVDRAEASFERQKQFIGNASHEMQTPLAVCRNRLEMLVDDARTLTPEQLASMADMSVEDVKAAIKRYEEEKVILGYKAIVDWDRTDREAVTALIEVKVTPQRGEGFDRVAERIYQYDEVESVYLMSGAYDLTVIISGRSLKEVAQFVGERLSTLEDVTGTATHFILHKYKEKHLIFEKQETQEKEWIFS